MTPEQEKELGIFLNDPRAGLLIEYLEEQKKIKTQKIITGEAFEPELIKANTKVNIYLHNTILADIRAIDKLLQFIKNCKEEAKEKTDD